MSGQIEIKLVVNEVEYPRLYAKLVAQSNPRQRAALLRRFADDGCRPDGSRTVAAAPETPEKVAPTASLEAVGEPIEAIRRSTPPASPSTMAMPRPIAASKPTPPAIPFAPGMGAATLAPDPDNVMLDAEAADQIFSAWG